MKNVEREIGLLMRSKRMQKLITIIPFLMLLITLITSFMRIMEVYSVIYFYLSQIMGYSILTNVYMLWNAVKNKYCSYSVISIISLLLLNVSNLIAIMLGFENNDIYIIFDAVLIAYLFQIAFVKFLKNKNFL
tara:strand:+ start:318 stop:716 length:399 start_codon:yes stop_codon:yes gene_type:complete